MSGILWLFTVLLVGSLAIHTVKRVLIAKKKEHAHEVLLKRVKRLRIYKMLKFLGADPDEYLHVIQAVDINRQIHRCTHCKEHESCDSCLLDGKRLVNMNFCPNHQSLTEHSKTIYQRRL
jgi:hypothetical protein